MIQILLGWLAPANVLPYPPSGGFVDMPSADSTCPRKTTLCWKKWYFLGLTFKLNSSKDLIKELIVSCWWLSSSLCRLIWAILNYHKTAYEILHPYSMHFIQNKVVCLNCNSIKCTPFRHKTLVQKYINSKFQSWLIILINKHKSSLIKLNNQECTFKL